jgi:hypothetical protein
MNRPAKLLIIAITLGLLLSWVIASHASQDNIVIPRERVGRFTMGMAPEQLMRWQKPNEVINKKDVRVYKYFDERNNQTAVYIKKDMAFMICFTDPYFVAPYGLSVVNFDSAEKSKYVNVRDIKGDSFYDVVGGGLFFVRNTTTRQDGRYGCITRY